VAGTAEVSEDAFKFTTPVIFGWVFYACCEEGDSCLDISVSSFAEEQELGNCVVEGLGLRFWQEFGFVFVAYGEEVICHWGCAGRSEGLGEVSEYF
jgi:hypothetical protein